MKNYIKNLSEIFEVDIKMENVSFEENTCIDTIEELVEIDSSDNVLKENIKKLIREYCNLYKAQLEKQARENFINDIVELKFDNIDLMLNRSELLGFDFYIERQAIIIEIEDLYKILKGNHEMILQKYKEEFYKEILSILKTPKDIVSYIGNNRFLICKTRENDIEKVTRNLIKNLKKRWDLTYKIAVGDLYDMPGIEAMSYSFRDATNYLKIGKRFALEEEVYTFEKIGIYTLFYNLGKFEKEKIMQYIKKSVDYGKQNRIDVAKLLSVYYKNKFVLNKTASEFGISTTKLKDVFINIQELSKLDPTKFEDAVKFYMAIKLLK